MIAVVDFIQSDIYDKVMNHLHCHGLERNDCFSKDPSCVPYATLEEIIFIVSVAGQEPPSVSLVSGSSCQDTGVLW
jgi:hypothetical protein